MLLADTLMLAVNYGYEISVPWTLFQPSDSLLLYAGALFRLQRLFGHGHRCGKMFRITIPENFNSPYKAVSVKDFWKRWHITLSSFLQTYIYFPLGGSRRGKARTIINTLITFLISGLWHGANWTFVFWGCFTGSALL